MGIFKRGRRNLQPWLDYFEMLQAYEQKGFLEVLPEKHEAYMTQTALLTLSAVEGKDGTLAPRDMLRMLSGVVKSVRRIRTYAGWKSQHGGDYLSRPFAMHVVRDDEPHDLLHTILLTRKRTWRRLWMKAESVEVIDYE